MKKWISICLMTCLLAGSSTVSHAGEIFEYIRVGMETVNLDYTATAKCADGFAVYQYQNGDVTLIKGFPEISSAQIKVSEGAISLVDSTDTVVYSYDNSLAYCVGPVNIEESIWELDGTKYRGAMMFLKSNGSTARQINVLIFEQYLYGVVPKEMSNSYPLEALKAQAVAARCFSSLNGTTHKSSGYDVCVTTHCQVYGGVSSEAPKCTQAVDETAGIFIRVNGSPVACYYSANNGGYIDASQDVWGTNISYLQAKADPYNPSLPWTATYTASELSTMLINAGKDVGAVKSVSILSKSQSGSVLKLEFVGQNGTAVFEKEKIRTFLGGSKLKSLKFDVTEGGGNVNNTIVVFMKDHLSAAAEKSLQGLYAISSNGITAIPASDIYSAGRDITKKVEVGSITGGETGIFTGVTFSGNGNGHGIGMSQQGAKVMADQGATYKEILEFYFTDIEVY